MFKKGLLLSIIFLLIFSITGFASFYKYTEESGADFYVGTGDHADALENTNELRQIIDDIGNLIGHSKRDDSYPEDGTTGGSAQYTGDGSLLTGVGEATATGLTVEVKEENTGPITKGQPVYVSGSTGAAFPEVGLADSDDPAKYEVIGLAAEDITQNLQGLVRTGGVLTGVDSLGATAINPDNETWLPSDLLFLHTTTGGLTKTEPTTGRVIEVGYSLYGSSNTDAILLMLHIPHIHIEVASGENIVFRMGDSAGTNKTIFKGYDNVEVASVDSDGKADFNELILDTPLPIAEGGTNSGTALNNDFVIISNTGAIVESATITVTELGLLNGLSGIQPLDTALTNISALAYVSPSFIKLTNTDTYAVRTLSEVRTDLSLVIGTNVQAFDDALDSISGLVYASPSFIKLTADDTYAVRTLAETRTDIGAAASGANTDITSILNPALYTGRDADNQISWATDDRLKIKIGGVEHTIADIETGTGDNDSLVTQGYVDDKITDISDYTNLTSFVDQTAWRLFYSNTDGDVIELAFGDDGKFLMSNGASAGLTFEALPIADTDTTGVLTDTDWDTFNNKEPELTDEASLYSTLSDVTEFIETGDSIIRNYYSALGSDHTYSDNADTDSQPVGESVVFGDFLYKDWATGEWMKAKADVFGTTPALRIALESKSDGQTTLMLIKGYIRDDSAFDFGASRIFLNDDTAGTADDTAPAESGDQIQVVGTAISADVLFFDPSEDVGEI